MRKMKKVDRGFIQSLGKNKISELNLHQIGRLNQKRVADYYENQGYKVLDVNERGFPDLVVIPDDKIFHKLLFVEVKGGEHAVHARARLNIRDKTYVDAGVAFKGSIAIRRTGALYSMKRLGHVRIMRTSPQADGGSPCIRWRSRSCLDARLLLKGRK